MRIEHDPFISIPREHSISPTESMASYQSGDIIKGTVLDLTYDEILLQLNDGQKIKAQMSNLLELQIGKSFYFQIDSFSQNQIFLTLFQKETKNTKLDFILHVLEKANMIPSPKNIQIVELLLEHQLPIDREHIQKALFYMHIVDKPTVENMILLLNKNIPLSKENILGFEEYIVTRIPLGDRIKNLFQELNEKLNPSLKENVDLVWLQYQQQKKEYIISILETYIEQNQFKTKGNPSFLAKEDLSLSTIKDLKVLHLLQKDEKLLAIFNDLLLQPKEKSAKTMEYLSVQKLTSNLDCFQCFPLKLQEISNPNAVQIYYQRLYEKLYILEKTFNNLDNKFQNTSWSNMETIKLDIQNLKQGLEFINAFNQYESFLPIPLQFSKEICTGELYLFKNKKQQKKQKKHISALLCLQLTTLGPVEVFIQKEMSQVYCQFKVKNKDIEHLFKKQLSILQNVLYKKGYTLTSAVSTIKDKTMSIIHLANREEEANIKTKQYFFDKKV